MRVFPLAVALLASFVLPQGAGNQPVVGEQAPIAVAEQKRSTPVDFEKGILPIFKNNCLACHNRTKAKAGLVLETPQTILKGGESGPAVVPGRGVESLLLKAAAHQIDPTMPPRDNKVAASNLTPQELGLLKLWIDQGAKGEVHNAANIRWNPLPQSLNPIYAVALTRDGQFAACGRADQILIYNIPSGQIAARLTDPNLTREISGTSRHAAAHRDRVYALAFSPDGTFLASGDFREAKLWRRPKATRKFSLVGAAAQSWKATPDQTAVVWDINPVWTLDRLVGAADASSPIVDRVNALRFSPDGGLMATGSGEPTRGGEIKIWQMADGKLAQELLGIHSDAVLGLDFSADGKFLASVAADKLLKVTELATGKVVKSFPGHTHHILGVSWKRDGTILASAGADNVIKIWDFATGEGKKTIDGFSKEVTAVSFIGATDQVVACSGDNQVRTIKENGDKVRAFDGVSDFMHSVAVTPDGRIVVAGGQDGILRVWNGVNGQAIAAFASPKE